jgi:hypothetical protein
MGERSAGPLDPGAEAAHRRGNNATRGAGHVGWFVTRQSLDAYMPSDLQLITDFLMPVVFDSSLNLVGIHRAKSQPVTSCQRAVPRTVLQ